MNMALSSFIGFNDPLKNVLKVYFIESACEEITHLIFNEVTNYQIKLKTNPDRKITKYQRKDQNELIETMKELNIRLNRIYIPLPLYDSVKAAYVPRSGGKLILSEEISCLLLRLQHLQQLFESIEIQTPAKTNPGKPERDSLSNALAAIFDDFAKDYRFPNDLCSKKAVDDKKWNFVTDIFGIFNIKDPVPRNV
jgi:hypothetical protein